MILKIGFGNGEMINEGVGANRWSLGERQCQKYEDEQYPQIEKIKPVFPV